MEIEAVKEITSNFFNKMMIMLESLDVSKEDENIFYIKIKTQDSSLLIWYSWKNLEDIRTVLKWILSKINNKNIILHLEINDYLSKKDDKLFDFIQKKIEAAKNGKEIILPFFNAYERKKIHWYVTELKDDTIFTKSIGEWEERRIHIYTKNRNMTIDMDGIGI